MRLTAVFDSRLMTHNSQLEPLCGVVLISPLVFFVAAKTASALDAVAVDAVGLSAAGFG